MHSGSLASAIAHRLRPTDEASPRPGRGSRSRQRRTVLRTRTGSGSAPPRRPRHGRAAQGSSSSCQPPRGRLEATRAQYRRRRSRGRGSLWSSGHRLCLGGRKPVATANTSWAAPPGPGGSEQPPTTAARSSNPIAHGRPGSWLSASLRLPLVARSWGEEGFAVVAAEQEDEPLQVLAQLGGAVGGVADAVFQGWAEASRVAG